MLMYLKKSCSKSKCFCPGFQGVVGSRCLLDCLGLFCCWCFSFLFGGGVLLLGCFGVCSLWPSCIRAVGTLPRATGSFSTAEGKPII